ncbi:sugar transferase [Mangrovicella endophytica]|uniref:sugar transferase n=1 Tax=Mangrovicella endophytica TaxID=2066697 RepID=UPI000C9E1332|nr:sugar transferase [Mangrovicella endophytica]
MKRLFDVTFSLLGLVGAGWLIVVLAWRISRDGEGPGLFAQTRVGRHGRTFTCYKLRTMHAATVNAASHDTPASAVTEFGRFLRRTKLDELPQLWNVLKGDMSFVGPRPCLPLQHQLIEERRRRCVYSARPGITGLAQVQGVDMSEPERLAVIDAEYVATRSFLGDLALILRTVAGGGQGDRVAR